jgi:putative Mg2+ transporter-C (MgtC) family protein
MSSTEMNQWTAVLRVLGSALLGGAVGWDRETRHRSSAGIRTHMMVGAGACLFVVTAVLAFTEENLKAEDSGQTYLAQNPDRILAGIATGVGFLGGGAIIQESNGNVRGLTTAAGLWTVAGIGATVAYGRWVLGSMTAALAVLIEVSDSIFAAIRAMIAWRTTRSSNELPSPIVTNDVVQESPEKLDAHKEKGKS